MSISHSYVGEDSTGFSQIVPTLYTSGGFSPLGKRTRSSSSLSFDLEEHQLKRRGTGEETIFPFDFYSPPNSADSAVSELDSDDLDLAAVDFDFGSIGTTSQQQKASALEFQPSELFTPGPFHRPRQQQQRAMQVAGDSMSQTTSIAPHAGQEPRLEIIEEPEEYYRARYESEGVRAPLKGAKDNHPTVKVIGQCQYGGHVDVELVYEDGSRHTSCSLDLSEERRSALTKKIGPHNSMTAAFEDLRIRREIRCKKMGGKKQQLAEKGTSSRVDGRNDKVACLLFTATVEVAGKPNGSPLQLSVISRPITLSTPPDPAELDWIRPETGHFHGGDEIVIKGSKMTSPKVTFHISVPNPSGNARYDLAAVVEKDKSHQNVLLVKTPSLPPALVSCLQPKEPVRAIVTVSTGRSTKQSNPVQFWFIPDGICNNCMQQVKVQQPISSPLCTVPLGSSPPPTPNLMDKFAMVGYTGMTPVKMPSHGQHGAPKRFNVQHQPMKHEFPPSPFPSPSSHEMQPTSFPPPSSRSQMGQFSSHQPAISIGMGTSIGSMQFGPPGYLVSSSSLPNMPIRETKPTFAPISQAHNTHSFLDSDLATAMESSSETDAELFSYLMGRSDEDTSTSSPEPEDDIDFPADFVNTCSSLSFNMASRLPCTGNTSVSTSPYLGQLSPASVASPAGCNTPPCYSPITPVTSPRQRVNVVPITNGNLLCGAAVPGGHGMLTLSQSYANTNHHI